MENKGKRRYRFTLNNYTDEDIQQVNDFVCTYMVYGYEIAPTTGTPHLQGYLETKENKTMSAICKKIKRISLHECDASPEHNRAYCIKDCKFVERGTISQGQGKRNDIQAIRDHMEAGTLLMRNVVLETTNLQVIRHAEIVLKYHEKERDWQTHVSWYWGSTGSGKSQAAKKDLGPGYYKTMRNLKWWEGYDAHENVWIDDMRARRMEFDDLLDLLDSTGFRVECKGGSRQLLAKKIIITAPCPPDKMYKNTGEDMKQLLRRINVIKHFGNDEKEEEEEFNEL